MRVILTRFAEAGARTVLVDINGDWGQTTADALAERGHEALYVKTDVRRSDQVNTMAAATRPARWPCRGRTWRRTTAWPTSSAASETKRQVPSAPRASASRTSGIRPECLVSANWLRLEGSGSLTLAVRNWCAWYGSVASGLRSHRRAMLRQGQALGADLGAGDVPAAEIAVEQLGAAKGAVRGVAEGVRLRVVDQEVELAVRVGAVDARGLVTGDVRAGRLMSKARPSGRAGTSWTKTSAGPALPSAPIGILTTRRANVSATYRVSRSAESAMPFAKRSGTRVPEQAGAGVEVEAPDARTELLKVVAVRDVQAVALRVHDRDVRYAHPGGAVASRETIERARRSDRSGRRRRASGRRCRAALP